MSTSSDSTSASIATTTTSVIPSTISIRRAEFPKDAVIAQQLLSSYGTAMPLHLQPALKFQGLDQEVAKVAEKWSCSKGRSFLIAFNEETQEPLGCVALRPLELQDVPESPVAPSSSVDAVVVRATERRKTSCEMKRLYTHPAARGHGVGKRLVVAIIEEGRTLGYDEMRLDTVPEMSVAIKLYESLEFEESEKYNETPAPGIVFFRKDLRSVGRP